MSFINKLLSIFSDHEDQERYEDNDYDINLDDDYSMDYENDDDEDDGMSLDEVERFGKALEKFYSRLSEKEREDDDLDEAINNLNEQFFEGKIKNPEKALSDMYKEWKSSKATRKIKKGNARKAIIDKLWHFDELTYEQKEDLNDSLDQLKESDEDEIDKIIKYWFDNKILDEDKFQVINNLTSNIKSWNWFPDFGPIEEVPLTEDNYKMWKLILENKETNWEFYSDYLKNADFFMRYWKESGNIPQPIDCDDMIVNRPCYLNLRLQIATPHFHLKKRYFDKTSLQEAIVYLFDDSLEYIADEGHVCINYTDMIDVSLNNWDTIHWTRERISDWVSNERHGNGNRKPCPDDPEPELLEITIRDGKKIYFTRGRLSRQCKEGEKGYRLFSLFEMRALIYCLRLRYVKSQQNN